LGLTAHNTSDLAGLKYSRAQQKIQTPERLDSEQLRDPMRTLRTPMHLPTGPRVCVRDRRQAPSLDLATVKTDIQTKPFYLPVSHIMAATLARLNIVCVSQGSSYAPTWISHVFMQLIFDYHVKTIDHRVSMIPA